MGGVENADAMSEDALSLTVQKQQMEESTTESWSWPIQVL
jgi:hypothetical protein